MAQCALSLRLLLEGSTLPDMAQLAMLNPVVCTITHPSCSLVQPDPTQKEGLGLG